MTHFSDEEKAFFKQNGYVVKPDLIAPARIENARDAVWEHIDADRNDPQTWIDAGPTGNLPCSDHPAIAAMTTHTPLYDMAEELAGKGRLRPPGNALCKMIYPTGRDDWRPPRGHLDGYLIDGVADTFTIAVTINISDVLPRGGGFTTWAGSHLKVAGYFQRHALTNLSGLKAPDYLPPSSRYEHAAPAGTVCFWHHYMLHTASMNCRQNIRMALVNRFTFTNLRDIMFDLPFDLWAQWDGLRDIAGGGAL